MLDASSIELNATHPKREGSRPIKLNEKTSHLKRKKKKKRKKRQKDKIKFHKLQTRRSFQEKWNIVYHRVKIKCTYSSYCNRLRKKQKKKKKKYSRRFPPTNALLTTYIFCTNKNYGTLSRKYTVSFLTTRRLHKASSIFFSSFTHK